MIERVGVVGLGVVGGAVSRALTKVGTTVCVYDSYLGLGAPAHLAECDVVFLCVPTPSFPESGFDVSEVWTAVREVEPVLHEGSIVAVKSTVPPGTINRLSTSFPRIEFAAVPEFLVATRPDESFVSPERVVVGTRSPHAARVVVDLMGEVAPEAPAMVVRPTEAELVKLCSNAFLAAKVAMANELADVCDLHEVSWPRVKSLVGLDRRIGPDHLSVTAERGFGGACLPKDLDGLIGAVTSAGQTPLLLTAIAEFNRGIRIRANKEGAGSSQPWLSSTGTHDSARPSTNGHRPASLTEGPRL